MPWSPSQASPLCALLSVCLRARPETEDAQKNELTQNAKPVKYQGVIPTITGLLLGAGFALSRRLQQSQPNSMRSPSLLAMSPRLPGARLACVSGTERARYPHTPKLVVLPIAFVKEDMGITVAAIGLIIFVSQRLERAPLSAFLMRLLRRYPRSHAHPHATALLFLGAHRRRRIHDGHDVGRIWSAAYLRDPALLIAVETSITPTR